MPLSCQDTAGERHHQTADIDFQSESGKWQATAMKVSP